MSALPLIVRLVLTLSCHDGWSIAQLEAYLRGPLTLPERYVTEFEIQHLPYTRRVHGGDPVAESADEMVERVTVVVDGSRVRQTILREGSAGTSSHIVSIWDGSRQAIYWPKERSVIIEKDGVPVPPNMHDVALAFNQLYGPMIGMHFWLLGPEHGGERRVESVARHDGELHVTFRGAIREDYVGNTWHMRFTSDVEPRLLALERLIPMIGSPEPVQIQRWRVDSWRDTEQGVMPEQATYTILGRLAGEDVDHTWYEQQFLYRRLSFRVLGPDEIDGEMFEIPAARGTRVADRQLGISYQFGENHLRFGETLYALPESIREPPGDRLGELLEQAVPMAASDGSDLLSTDSAEDRTLRIAMWVGLAVFVLVFAALKFGKKLRGARA